jgi:hypothetical protein
MRSLVVAIATNFVATAECSTRHRVPFQREIVPPPPPSTELMCVQSRSEQRGISAARAGASRPERHPLPPVDLPELPSPGAPAASSPTGGRRRRYSTSPPASAMSERGLCTPRASRVGFACRPSAGATDHRHHDLVSAPPDRRSSNAGRTPGGRRGRRGWRADSGRARGSRSRCTP